jgi:hypothetical protein
MYAKSKDASTTVESNFGALKGSYEVNGFIAKEEIPMPTIKIQLDT